jgi:beta-glucosidase
VKRTAFAVMFASALWFGLAAAAQARSPLDSARARAQGLVSQMTLDEKLQLVHGAGFVRNAGYAGRVTGIPRLGIPGLFLADGPNGVGNGATGVTAFPAAINGASSWDPGLMRRYGSALGREMAGKGNNVALAPTINILRVPGWGRAFETFSEDPHLTAAIGKAEIVGVQHQGVIATAKHFAVNNQETRRDLVDAKVGARARREIYLPAFESAVQDARVLAVMCAYNRVNGQYACENRKLLSTLADDWGFRGLVMSDWAATHTAGRSALAGLDLEMPFGPAPGYPQWFGDPLRAAVESGEVPMTRLDDMVRRILTAVARAGLLDHTPTGNQAAQVSTPAHRRLAQSLSAQGTVLLKNRRRALPIGGRRVRSLAVIGAAAQGGAIYTGGGSASVLPSETTTPLAGVLARAGKRIKISYAPGTAGTGALPDVPGAMLKPDSGGGSGLAATYWATSNFTGPPAATRVEPTVDFAKDPPPALGGRWSARWSGTFTPQTTGTHRFSLAVQGIARLYVNGRRVIDNYGRDHSPVEHALVKLKAGAPVSIRLDYVAEMLPRRTPALQLGWLAPDPRLRQAAVAAARAADAAVVFVNDLRTEGFDNPTLALPADQDALIRSVAAANRRTVVVLNTGGPVLMPWLDDVRAVVEAWYPGQANGAAIASILFGDVNPSGKLPVTFPRSDSQTPLTRARWPGTGNVARYDDGLFVGYRWFDARRRRPLFPFGHGLSYTKFRYGLARVTPGRGGKTAVVRVRIRNTGRRAGAEVVQLYVRFPRSAGEPPRQLKAFRKVRLRPGRRATVHLRLQLRDLASWSGSGHRWVIHKGAYRLLVGSSSRDIRATAGLRAR